MKFGRVHSLILVFALSVMAGVAQPTPPLPQAATMKSPTEIFRQLLAMDGAQRAEFLASKSAQQRERIEAKVQEYLALTPAARESRLQTLEIRWHMLQLMNLAPANRADRLGAVPEQYRTLVRQRLMQWDILPPPLKKDVLDNETVIRLFVQLRTTGRSAEELLAELPLAQREQLQRDFERWQQLPPQRREQMCGNFDRFFGLDHEDRSRTLSALSEQERKKMEVTLAVFDKLPAEQRERIVDGFRKFKDLAPAERQEFLRSAQRWTSMSERDRDLWRQIVTRAHAAQLMPPPFPPRPSAQVFVEPVLATNN